VARVTAIFAYADPPYVGCSHFYDHPDAARWDDPEEHVALMHRMHEQYNGWALSCSVPSLAAILPGAPEGTRVAAWVKPFCAYKRNVRVAYSWEPVLWARTLPRRDADPVGRDHLSANITMRRGFTGAKPEEFTRWLYVLLGAQPSDDIDDLFPGSGAVARELAVPRML
jgi:hypothetical protein